MYNITMPKDKTFKKEAFKIYCALRNKSVFCPALNEDVFFTLLGWNHLVGNESKHRHPKDVFRRLKLLPLAEKILVKAGTIQSIRTVKGQVMYGLDSIESIEINGNQVLTKVRVIVVDTKTGKKFLSIMDRKML